MACARGQPQSSANPSFTLSANGRSVVIYAADHPPVLRAAQDLAADIGRVTGSAPRVVTRRPENAEELVVIGVIGQSPEIDAIVKARQLDTEGVAGNWESWVRSAVQSPWPGVKRALVLAGSDDRGAVYGIYRISEEIGVSPWYWWADVPVEHRTMASITAQSVKQGPPAVKYRGIFLNDEDWGLRPWAAQTLDRPVRNIGPNTYARIFELLLRLGANTCWPAMHPGSAEFNHFPENRELANRYGIVMGSSHCEQMLRNNVAEWPHDQAEGYNYRTNREGVLRYWEERVKTNGRYENMYTLGMRGVHDGEMAGGGTVAEKAALYQQIIADQRELLKRWVNPNVPSIPQIFCPYKEVLEIYRQMAGLPNDITLVWPDDNFGYMRHFPTREERKRAGGSGLYYHVSYWGSPYDYLWLCSTPPALLHEELGKAWAKDARTVWILNVGDLKPAEYLMEYFLRLARTSPANSANESEAFLRAAFTRDFGPTHAAEMAAIMAEYYHLNFVRRPEHVGIDAKNKHLARPIFSSALGADEASARLESWQQLKAHVERLAASLPQAQRDSFFELVYYPVSGAALINEKWLALQKFEDYQRQGRAAASIWLERARNAHEEIQRLTNTYNTAVNGGKWNGMMSAAPHAKAVFDFPATTAPTVSASSSWGILPEGSATPIRGGSPDTNRAALPPFSRLSSKMRTIDVFMGGRAQLSWTAQTNKPWITIEPTKGTGDGRITVEIAWAKLPKRSPQAGSVRVNCGTEVIEVAVAAGVPPGAEQVPSGSSVESDGRVAFSAGDARSAAADVGAWKRLAGLGYSNAAVAASDLGKAATHPLEFTFWNETTGLWAVHVRMLPTWPLDERTGQRVAVALDGGPPATITLPIYRGEQDPQWQVDVLRNSTVATGSVSLSTSGLHRLRIWPLSEGLVFDEVLLESPKTHTTPYLWAQSAFVTQ